MPVPRKPQSNTLDRLLEAAGLAPAKARETTTGGDIADSARVTLTNGKTVFIKRAPDAPADFFPAEAHGLEALREAAPMGLIRVPEVYHAGAQGLVLEWLEPVARASDYDERFEVGS